MLAESEIPINICKCRIDFLIYYRGELHIYCRLYTIYINTLYNKHCTRQRPDCVVWCIPNVIFRTPIKVHSLTLHLSLILYRRSVLRHKGFKLKLPDSTEAQCSSKESGQFQVWINENLEFPQGYPIPLHHFKSVPTSNIMQELTLQIIVLCRSATVELYNILWQHHDIISSFKVPPHPSIISCVWWQILFKIVLISYYGLY